MKLLVQCGASAALRFDQSTRLGHFAGTTVAHAVAATDLPAATLPVGVTAAMRTGPMMTHTAIYRPVPVFISIDTEHHLVRASLPSEVET